MKPIRIDQKWIAIGISILTSGLIVLLLAAFSISVLDEYGLILFVLVPLLLGFMSSAVYGYNRQRTFTESLAVSFYSLIFVCAGLVVVKIEGLLCVVMASPFVSVFVIIGAFIGYRFQRIRKRTIIRILSVNILVIPLLMTVETYTRQETPDIVQVNTSIIVNAPIEEVWKNVIAFPPIGEPEELLFKTGIAYPTSSRIVGSGVGSIRYCEFTTGQFIEPIVAWDAPHRLQFIVEEQPAPLKNMLTNEVPPNMYKYFTSTKGEFCLTPLDDSITLLEGRTWYYHKIKPASYWRLWSQFIVHSIHTRVLNHIKIVSENDREQTPG